MNNRRCHFLNCNSVEIFGILLEGNGLQNDDDELKPYCKEHYNFVKKLRKCLKEMHWIQQKKMMLYSLETRLDNSI